MRSLYDGLSHLYTDCDSRLRHIPSTNYAEKRRKQMEQDGEVASDPDPSGRVRSPDLTSSMPRVMSPHRIASPHRMSDSELRTASATTRSSVQANDSMSRAESRADSVASQSGFESGTGSNVGRPKKGMSKKAGSKL